MLVRAKEAVFVEGSRRKAGAIFDYSGPLGDALEAVAGETPVAEKVSDKTEPSRKDLQAMLELAGVKYGANDNKETLAALLKEAQAQGAPGSVQSQPKI